MARNTPNTDHGADIVVETGLVGYTIWQNDDVIASATLAARDLIVAGAAERRLTVYDTLRGEFLCGDFGQLVP